MKKLFLLTLLLSPVSIVSMGKDEGVSEESEAPAAAFNIGIKIKLDQDDIVRSLRDQRALIQEQTEKQMASNPENLYATILGENYYLISDDMSDQEREQAITNVWNREKSRVEARSLADLEGIDEAFLDKLLRTYMPNAAGNLISPEQKNIMMDAARTSILEVVERDGYTSLKTQVDFVRTVLAVRKKVCNNQTRATSTTHHTIQ